MRRSLVVNCTNASLRTFEMMTRIFRNDKLYLGQEHNDIEILKRGLASRNVTVLDNSNVRITTGGVDLWLAGVDDLMEGTPDINAALADAPEPDRRRAAYSAFPQP